jgi:hypothetical protein
MGFDLEIIFQGMCTFVPDPDGNKLWVLMRDRASRSGEVPPHAAAIRFPLASLAPGAPGLGLRMLNNLDVRIAGQGQEGVRFKDFDVATGQARSASPSPDSFSWVSPLEEACSRRNLAGGGVIDRRFLRPHPELSIQDANRLAARFLFTTGTVATAKLFTLDGRILESTFRPPSESRGLAGDLLQPTAAMISLKTFIDADSVTFETTTLRTGTAATPLTLRPAGSGNTLRISIMNEEGESLVGLPGAPARLGAPRPQDRIFLSMFDFCRNPPKKAERPMPIPERTSTRFASFPRDILLNAAPPCSPCRGTLG